MSYQKICALVSAGLFLVGLVLVLVSGHAKAVEETLLGGFILLAVAHT